MLPKLSIQVSISILAKWAGVVSIPDGVAKSYRRKVRTGGLWLDGRYSHDYHGRKFIRGR